MAEPDIAVIASEPAHLGAARRLAAELGLPLADAGDDLALVLRCADNGLELVLREENGRQSIIRVDFTDPRSTYRHGQPRKELLVRAMGSRKGRDLEVIDATGGLGRDSFLLASAGCRVRVYERQPIAARLLRDGLERAREHPATARAAQRIELVEGDAVQALEEMRQHDRRVAAVYLAPMFPQRRKSARVKKESRALQLLAGPADDPARLLDAARHVGSRVVVKRPRTAPPLADRKPDYSLDGKSVRFDVYLRANRG
jgi:16S rRNA (guanine1516-N2)-methyltransferase